jgi:nicotinamide riboside transporter PnuC
MGRTPQTSAYLEAKTESMFRLFFTYILPLIAPVGLYLVWNWIQMRRVAAGKRAEPTPSFAEMPWLILLGAGVSLMVVTLLALFLFSTGGKPGGSYVPPHMENGKIVPAENR